MRHNTYWMYVTSGKLSRAIALFIVLYLVLKGSSLMHSI